MKLRNKKTGQLGNFIINKDHFECVDLDYVPEYRNLAELNAEWEDYEETKPWYTINKFDASAQEINDDSCLWIDEAKESVDKLGLKFATEEEAERAIEKLKAWKRLKDKGFRFDGYDVAHKSNGNLAGQIFYDAGKYSIEEIDKEMAMLFGGEE